MLIRLLFGVLLAMFCTVPLISSAVDIEDGLVLYLPLNEGRGDAVKDLGPFQFETEMSKKAPEWVKVADNPLIDAALEFDGQETFVKIDMAGQERDVDSHTDEEKRYTTATGIPYAPSQWPQMTAILMKTGT